MELRQFTIMPTGIAPGTRSFLGSLLVPAPRRKASAGRQYGSAGHPRINNKDVAER